MQWQTIRHVRFDKCAAILLFTIHPHTLFWLLLLLCYVSCRKLFHSHLAYMAATAVPPPASQRRPPVRIGADVRNTAFQFLTRDELVECAAVDEQWEREIRRNTPYFYSRPSPTLQSSTFDLNTSFLLLQRRRLVEFELKCTSSLHPVATGVGFGESAIGDIERLFANCPVDVRVSR